MPAVSVFVLIQAFCSA